MRGNVIPSVNAMFVEEDCITCGISFCMTQGFKNQKLRDKTTFYCPNGHEMHYIGENVEKRLRRELEEQKKITEYHRERAKSNERRAIAMKAVATRRNNEKIRVMARIHAGVCPHCNRTFQNLSRHMATKHGRGPR